MGSALNRTEDLAILAHENNLDMIAVTESGLIEDQHGPQVNDYIWRGTGKNEADRSGGGVGWLIKEKVCSIPVPGAVDDELHVWTGCRMGEDKIALCAVYCKQGGNKQARSVNKRLLDQIARETVNAERCGYKCVVCGDFNAHGNHVENMD